MKLARSGLPFVGGFVVAAAIAAGLGAWGIALLLLLGAGYMTYFFRDPDRVGPTGADVVLAPGDGRIMATGEDPDGRVGLSIFLGLLDVHVNRAPADGVVQKVERMKGRYRAAFRDEAGQVNAQCRSWFDTAAGPVEMRQIVGVAARRLEFWKQPGDVVKAGERVGLMKFGSRIDLLLPPGSRLEVAQGARVRAGVTLVARLPARDPGGERA